MTGFFILLAVLLAVAAAVGVFARARRSRRAAGSVHAERTPPSPPTSSAR